METSSGGSERGIGELPAHLFPSLVFSALLCFILVHTHLLDNLIILNRHLNSFCGAGGNPAHICPGASGVNSSIALHLLVVLAF